jgi:hypothetical protein
MKRSIKRRVLQFFAKFFGKAMFASLHLDGTTAMIISEHVQHRRRVPRLPASVD